MFQRNRQTKTYSLVSCPQHVDGLHARFYRPHVVLLFEHGHGCTRGVEIVRRMPFRGAGERDPTHQTELLLLRAWEAGRRDGGGDKYRAPGVLAWQRNMSCLASVYGTQRIFISLAPCIVLYNRDFGHHWCRKWEEWGKRDELVRH